MFCRNCGSKASDDAVFCHECGKALFDESEASQVLVPAENPGHVPISEPMQASGRSHAPSTSDLSANNTGHAASSTKPTSRRSNRKVWLLSGVLVLLLVAMGVALYTQGAGEESEKLHMVYFHVNGEGYGESSSPVPVRVQGENNVGESVDVLRFVTAQDNSVELPQGSYTFTIAASPLLESGEIYDVSGHEYHVDVTESDAQEGGDTYETRVLVALNPADVTDEQLEEAYQFAQQAGFERADEYYALAVQARDDAIAQREADEQAQREAEEAARQQAEEEAAAQTEAEAQAQAEAEAARFDAITGTFWGTGMPAGSSDITSATLTDTELTLVGNLRQTNDGSGTADSIGNKTWVLRVDQNTEFGFYVADGFHQQSTDEFAQTLENLAFPQITVIVEDGYVVRTYTSA